MTKNDVIKEISRTTGIERTVVEATIESFMKTVEEQIVNKRTISLRGFGTFSFKKRAAKTARNISKNETIHLPACFVPFFKPSKKFSNRIKKLKSN